MAQYTRSTWEGRRLWTERGRQQASDGLRLALEFVLAESQKVVPLEEGTLQRSGKVDVEGLNGSVSYDTVYAVRQHEELTWRHLPGRTAKYLEGPMNSTRDQQLRLMAVPLISWLH